MFAAPLGVTCKALDAGCPLHPDLDDRDVQTCLYDRLSALVLRRRRSRRKRRSVGEADASLTVEVAEESTATDDDSIEATTPVPDGDGGEEVVMREDKGDEDICIFSPRHEGWLIKRGSGGLRIWRRRWVALANRRLWYASGPPARKEDAGHEKAIGWMEITEWTTIVEDEQNELTFTVMPGSADGLSSSPIGSHGGRGASGAHSDSEEDHGAGHDHLLPSIGKGDAYNPPRPGEGWLFHAESMPEKKVWMAKIKRCIELAAWWSQLLVGPSLGEGGYSQVHEMVDQRTGERFAVKCMETRRRLERDQTVAEVEILSIIRRKIRHPHLIAPRRIYVEGNRVWIMFPLCSGGDLFYRLVSKGQLPETEAAAIMYRVLSALNALHQHGILHLDVKPENILFGPEGQHDVRLADFGLSRRVDVHPEGPKLGQSMSSYVGGEEDEEDLIASLRRDAEYLRRRRHDMTFEERVNGTIGYICPEVVLDKQYSAAADMWSLGVVLHICLVGYPPFAGKPGEERETLDRSIRGEYTMDPLDWARISPAAKDLVRRMLTVDVSSRITTEEALVHPWLLKHGGSKNGGSGEYEPESILSLSASSSGKSKGVKIKGKKSVDSGEGGDRSNATSPFADLISTSFSAIIRSPVIRGSFLGRFSSIPSQPAKSSTSSSSCSSTSSVASGVY